MKYLNDFQSIKFEYYISNFRIKPEKVFSNNKKKEWQVIVVSKHEAKTLCVYF